MPTGRPKSTQYAVCVRNEGFEAAPEVRQLDAVLHDSAAEANNRIRIIDGSSEDYVSRPLPSKKLPGNERN
jgi:hypothetical protein